MSCHCGRPAPFDACCGRLHRGDALAATAEDLMRSRYSAFVTGNVDYVMGTHHPSTLRNADPEAIRNWSRTANWMGLEVLATEGGGPEDDEGAVEFVARYRIGSQPMEYRERSTFARHDGEWRFVEGTTPAPQARSAKVGRNEPCPCGSGKKYKKCCGG